MCCNAPLVGGFQVGALLFVDYIFLYPCKLVPMLLVNHHALELTSNDPLHPIIQLSIICHLDRKNAMHDEIRVITNKRERHACHHSDRIRVHNLTS